jgi:hypothetical protein
MNLSQAPCAIPFPMSPRPVTKDSERTAGKAGRAKKGPGGFYWDDPTRQPYKVVYEYTRGVPCPLCNLQNHAVEQCGRYDKIFLSRQEVAAIKSARNQARLQRGAGGKGEQQKNTEHGSSENQLKSAKAKYSKQERENGKLEQPQQKSTAGGSSHHQGSTVLTDEERMKKEKLHWWCPMQNARERFIRPSYADSLEWQGEG